MKSLEKLIEAEALKDLKLTSRIIPVPGWVHEENSDVECDEIVKKSEKEESDNENKCEKK